MFPFINSVGAALCGRPIKEPAEGLPYITNHCYALPLMFYFGVVLGDGSPNPPHQETPLSMPLEWLDGLA